MFIFIPKFINVDELKPLIEQPFYGVIQNPIVDRFSNWVAASIGSTVRASLGFPMLASKVRHRETYLISELAGELVDGCWHQDGHSKYVALLMISDTSVFNGGFITFRWPSGPNVYGPLKLSQGDLLVFDDTWYEHKRDAVSGPGKYRGLLNIKLDIA